MKRYMKVFMILALGVIIFLPGTAFATWSINWNESGVGPFDTIEGFIVSSSPNTDFTTTPTGFSNLNPATFVAQMFAGYPDYAYAHDSATTSISFTTNMTVAPTNLVLDLIAWNGGVLNDFVDFTRCTYNGGWSYQTMTEADALNHIGRPSDVPLGIAVPLPPSLLLLGTGLVGLGFLRRRKVKDGLAA